MLPKQAHRQNPFSACSFGGIYLQIFAQSPYHFSSKLTLLPASNGHIQILGNILLPPVVSEVSTENQAQLDFHIS